MCYKDIEPYLKTIEKELDEKFDITVEYIEDVENSFFFYEEHIIEIGLKQNTGICYMRSYMKQGM